MKKISQNSVELSETVEDLIHQLAQGIADEMFDEVSFKKAKFDMRVSEGFDEASVFVINALHDAVGIDVVVETLESIDLYIFYSKCYIRFLEMAKVSTLKEPIVDVEHGREGTSISVSNEDFVSALKVLWEEFTKDYVKPTV